MSVFVKEMKMPETCKECPIFDEWNACGVTGSWDFIDVFDPSKERLKDCPLVEVATPHGRLIDADEMCADLATVDPRYGQVVEWSTRVTDAQKTVIEAEE